MASPTTVDEYLATAPAAALEHLRALRALSLERTPGATEGLKWGKLAYSTQVILFVLSAHAQHCNVVFTPSTLEVFRPELEAAGFELGKGSVKLPHSAELPLELLGRTMTHRVREWSDEGVSWR